MFCGWYCGAGLGGGWWGLRFRYGQYLRSVNVSCLTEYILLEICNFISFSSSEHKSRRRDMQMHFHLNRSTSF